MALDKQKILNELGSVVNQLQSADCGCMGKIFSNCHHTSNNAINLPPSHGGCGHCCHSHGNHNWSNGYNAPCAGEPHSGNQNWRGSCNPRRLYADTYSYMNQNLMQPVIKEVYDDLKSISPANTLMNNPMASQMGLSSPGNVPLTGISSPIQENGGNMINTSYQMGQMGHSTQGNAQSPDMGGTNGYTADTMGQNIIGQMGLSTPGNASNMRTNNIGNMGNIMGKNLMEQMGLSASQNTPSGITRGVRDNTVNMMPQSQTSGRETYGTSNIAQNAMSGGANMYTGNDQEMARNPMYHAENVYTTNMQGNTMAANISQHMNPTRRMGDMGVQPTSQQITNQPQPQGNHGQQSAGVFNSMFPGVMQGLGGDLGFDPMSIAIQMNPSNQQKAAMDSMNKMMMNNRQGIDKVLDVTNNSMKPAVKGAYAVAASARQPTAPPAAESQQNATYQSIPSPQNGAPVYQINQQQDSYQAQQPENASMVQQPYQTPQQVYTAVSAAPHLQQQQIDPSPIAVDRRYGSVPPIYEGSEDPTSQVVQSMPAAQQNIKEPIFPADTSRYAYRAKPRDVAETKYYPHQQMPKLRNDAMRYSNVKSTVSKTSLMENKPVGNVPSRNQLQHIYNQYKGSQSFTQQNVKQSEKTSHSAGNLKVMNNMPQVPVERVGGDTIYNNRMNQQIPGIEEHMIGKMGDVPISNKPEEYIEAPTKQSKCRNGLQDMIFTSYPTTPAWSFHANAQRSYTGYRYR